MLVHRHYYLIQRLADVLVEKKRLDESEVEHLLDEWTQICNPQPNRQSLRVTWPFGTRQKGEVPDEGVF